MERIEVRCPCCGIRFPFFRNNPPTKDPSQTAMFDIEQVRESHSEVHEEVMEDDSTPSD